MLNFLRRIISRFFRNSRQINNEPLNKVSLVIVILIDLFILFNTFQGLNEISQWPISPWQAYPCQAEWQNYRQDQTENKDIAILRNTLERQPYAPSIQGSVSSGPGASFQSQYKQNEVGHLGSVSPICLNYGALQDGVTNPENQALKQQINEKQSQIQTLQNSSAQIRSQYDSTLLDQIAGQSPGQSINAVGAAQAKQTLTDNNNKAFALKQEIKQLEQQVIQNPGSQTFLALLKDDSAWQSLDRAYKRASFWHPSYQLLFQSLFLLPLIAFTLWIHRFCQRRGYGLGALISWHLLVIFFIPFVFKLFEILQFGPIFTAISSFILRFAQGLIFLVRYAAILTIPLLGFGLIRFFQRFVFNPKIQAANRVQKSRCIRCAKRLSPHDHHCPHCGYHQLKACVSCHELTYKHLPHCKNCGASQAASS